MYFLHAFSAYFINVKQNGKTVFFFTLKILYNSLYISITKTVLNLKNSGIVS